MHKLYLIPLAAVAALTWHTAHAERMDYYGPISEPEVEDMQSTPQPALPDPGPTCVNGGPLDCVQAAEEALARRAYGEAQNAVEMAVTRATSRSTPLYETDTPDHRPLISVLETANGLLQHGNYRGCMDRLYRAEEMLLHLRHHFEPTRYEHWFAD